MFSPSLDRHTTTNTWESCWALGSLPYKENLVRTVTTTRRNISTLFRAMAVMKLPSWILGEYSDQPENMSVVSSSFNPGLGLRDEETTDISGYTAMRWPSIPNKCGITSWLTNHFRIENFRATLVYLVSIPFLQESIQKGEECFKTICKWQRIVCLRCELSCDDSWIRIKCTLALHLVLESLITTPILISLSWTPIQLTMFAIHAQESRTIFQVDGEFEKEVTRFNQYVPKSLHFPSSSHPLCTQLGGWETELVSK